MVAEVMVGTRVGKGCEGIGQRSSVVAEVMEGNMEEGGVDVLGSGAVVVVVSVGNV